MVGRASREGRRTMMLLPPPLLRSQPLVVVRRCHLLDLLGRRC